MLQNPNIMDLNTLYKLDAYRFNLTFFTCSLEAQQLSSTEQSNILTELDRLDVVVEVMAKTLLPDYLYGKQVVVWSDTHENWLKYAFQFEFVSVESAARALSAKVSFIQNACSSRGETEQPDGLRIAYKEDFDQTIKNFNK